MAGNRVDFQWYGGCNIRVTGTTSPLPRETSGDDQRRIQGP